MKCRCVYVYMNRGLRARFDYISPVYKLVSSCRFCLALRNFGDSQLGLFTFYYRTHYPAEPWWRGLRSSCLDMRLCKSVWPYHLVQWSVLEFSITCPSSLVSLINYSRLPCVGSSWYNGIHFGNVVKSSCLVTCVAFFQGVKLRYIKVGAVIIGKVALMKFHAFI